MIYARCEPSKRCSMLNIMLSSILYVCVVPIGLVRQCASAHGTSHEMNKNETKNEANNRITEREKYKRAKKMS